MVRRETLEKVKEKLVKEQRERTARRIGEIHPEARARGEIRRVSEWEEREYEENTVELRLLRETLETFRWRVDVAIFLLLLQLFILVFRR